MEKLRKDDFLYSFFMAPGGTVIWIVRRKGEVFVNAIMNMRQWLVYHFPYDSSEREASASITGVTQLLSLLGFTEYPVFADVRNAEDTDFIKELRNQFVIFDDAAKKAQAEAQKKAAAQIAEQHGMVPVGEGKTGASAAEAAGLKVLPKEPDHPIPVP